MVEIDVKINGELFDRIHVTNTDVLHMGLTTYKVETMRGKTTTVQHHRFQGLYALLGRVFKVHYLLANYGKDDKKEV